ncbi:MAG: RICIN domain-containing protein, partial [Fibrobacterota bacterium]
APFGATTNAAVPSAALPAASALNYLPLQRKVRYFTWGAGVVDLDITSLNTTDNPEIAFNANSCYQLKSVSSGKALTATATGSVVQAPFTGAASQTWRLVGVDAFFRLENSGTGKVLEVAANSFKEGALLQAAAWNGADNQQWNIVRNGANYAFAARHSVKTLEIAAASIAASAKADQGVYTGAAHQNWSVVEAATCGSSPVRKAAPSDLVKLSPMGNGRYRIEGTEGADVHLLAWDRTGRIVRRADATTEIDLSALGKGVYHIRVWGGHIDATRTLSIVP